MMGFKNVTTLHNLIDTIDVEKTGFKNSLLNRASAFLITKLIASSSTVTLTMKSHTKLFQKRYHSKEAVTIPHGTWNGTEFQPTGVHEKDCLLYIGHSGPYKDLDLLFDAFSILEQKKRKLKLIFAGTAHPNYPNYLEKYKKRSDNVYFTGYVPETQLQALFEKANAVILPYRTCTGTSGIAHLPSSYGTPIVATDLPEFRELAKEGCGLLLSKHQAKAIAACIEEIMDNPNLALSCKEKT